MTKSSWHKFANQTPDGWHMIMLVTIFVMVLNNLCQLLQHKSMKGRNQMLLEYLWRLQPQVSCYHLNVSDIFAKVQSLNLALQKSGESLVLADIAVYLDKTMRFLEKLKTVNRRLFFAKQNLNNLFNFSKEAMASLPPSSCTQWNQQLFEWKQFEANVYMPFLDVFMKEVEAVFS